MNSKAQNDDQLMLKEMPQPSCASGSAMKVQFGKPIPPQQQVLLYSPAEWEEFILEWVHSKNNIYQNVQRFAGSSDMGIDVAGFTDDQGLHGIWDNFQCKHYDKALIPGTAAVEVAKIIWYSFKKYYAPPRRYYFMAPHGCGTSLTKMFVTPSALRNYVMENWAKKCANAITTTKTITLEGPFKIYLEAFDFSIFTSRNLIEVVDDHRSTPYYTIRFGGGLPDRPPTLPPPEKPEEGESRYIEKLFEAYTDHMRVKITGLAGLIDRKDLTDHFHRQREFFYHSEALRNFARDNVPPGTFEDLQSEVYAGVIDVEAASHDDAFARVNAVIQAATQLQLTSNALISVVKIQDRKGICHQLANDDRLSWRKS